MKEIYNIIQSLIFKELPSKMCLCSPEFSHGYGVDQESKKRLAAKLPKLLEEREEIKLRQAKDFFNWSVQCMVRKADLIFYNGTIYTMQDQNPKFSAIAVTKDRILAIGDDETILQLKGPNTRVIDLNNRTLLPGFIDPHIHMGFSAMKNWVELSPFIHKNMDEVRQKIIDSVKAAEEDSWVAFQLFDPMITNGIIDVSRKALDEISKTKAIFIYEANGHVSHVNSLAFQKVGVTKDTPDPDHGRFIRDAHGQLTGEVQEAANHLFTKKIPRATDKEYINNFQKFLSHTSSKGCTTLHDCGIGLVGTDTDLSVLHQVFRDQAPVRFSGYIVSTQWDDWMHKKMKPETKDTELRINGVKCWVDGSTQAGSAFLKEPYIRAEWGNGSANYQQDVLNKAVLEAHKKGFQVGIHANGDGGIDMALKAFENANKVQKKSNLRHRIEHSTVCHKAQLLKMKQLDVSPSFLIGHVYFYGAAFRDRILGTERAQLVDPMKSALDCGLIPTMHSDYNCQPIDPLRCIYNAVTRIMKDNMEVLNPNECVTPYEAVKAMTINAAWQCHMEDIVGSLKKGKFADFVILEQDPMKVEQSKIINIKIWQTWKGGQKWYQG